MPIEIESSYTVFIPIIPLAKKVGWETGTAKLVALVCELLHMLDIASPIGLAVIDDMELALTYGSKDDAFKVKSIITDDKELAKAVFAVIVADRKYSIDEKDSDDIPF